MGGFQLSPYLNFKSYKCWWLSYVVSRQHPQEHLVKWECPKLKWSIVGCSCWMLGIAHVSPYHSHGRICFCLWQLLTKNNYIRNLTSESIGIAGQWRFPNNTHNWINKLVRMYENDNYVISTCITSQGSCWRRSFNFGAKEICNPDWMVLIVTFVPTAERTSSFIRNRHSK